MKTKSYDEEYLERAQSLSDEEAELLLSRMGNKLKKRLLKDKRTQIETLSIQLQIEDEQLADWREIMAGIRQEEVKKEKKSKDK